MRVLKTLHRVLYRCGISPILHLLAGPGFGCRYLPVCSDYFIGSIERFGFVRGSIIGTKRVCSCHPWSKRAQLSAGWDPVPELDYCKKAPGAI